MLVKDFECRSYDQALEMLGGRNSRTVCINTLLAVADSGCVDLFLYGHQIIRFYLDRSMRLWSGGFRTATTKDRINRCLPGLHHLYQKGGKWFIGDSFSRQGIEFIEGMLIREDPPPTEDSGD